MAPPVVDKAYLPDLEPCLQGQTVVLSWRLVATALADTTGHRQNSQAIISFLTNPQIQSLFTKPNAVFEPPVQGAGDNDPYKQAFETKTAAVQVAPTPNPKFDVKTIKDDSIWLSNNARINLFAALRVVVIEFQSRARNQLTGPISSQDAVSLQEAAGATNAQTSSILPGLNLSGLPDAADLEKDFDTPESRRRRVFQTYLAERRYFAMATDYIFTLMLHERLPSLAVNTKATTTIRDSFLEAFGLTSVTPNSDTPAKTYHALVSRYFTVVSDSIGVCGDITAVAEDQDLHRDDLQIEWMKTFVAEAIHAMTVAFQLLDLSSHVLVSPELLQQWFQFVGDTSYLELLGSNPALSDLIKPVQCLVCLVSLAAFNVPRIRQHFKGEVEIDMSTEYIGSSDALELVHQVVQAGLERTSAPAIPIVFAWVPIIHDMCLSYQERAERRDALQNQKAIETYDSGTQMIPGAGRRNSAGSITTIDRAGYDDFLANCQLNHDLQPVEFLMTAVIGGDGLVYTVLANIAKVLGSAEDSIFAASVGSRMRKVLLELLEHTFFYTGYINESVQTLLAVLTAGDFNYWHTCRPSQLPPMHDVIFRSLHDDFILNDILSVASRRFPYEFGVFASICRAMSCAIHKSGDGIDLITQLLHKTRTLTFELPGDFSGYELAHEEDNTNTIRLTDDLPLFAVISNRRMISSEEESFVIPAGTYGRFVVDEGKIVLMEYEHSALALLGKRLEANLNPSIYHQELGDLSRDDTADAISLLATVVRSEYLKAVEKSDVAEASEAGLAILAETSRALPRTKDIVSVVCETMDVFLEGEPDSAALAVLTACLQFLAAALPLCPGRVWSYMSRSAILATESRGGRLSRLVGTLDLSNEQYEFLVSAIRLFSDLVETAMSSSVQRKVTVKPSRQRPNENPWLGISDKIVTQITVAIAQSVVDILESSSTWRFPTELKRTVLTRDLIPIINNTILYTFSLDDTTSKKTLTAPLQPAAKYFIDSFVASSAGNLRIQPLLATLADATQWPGSTICANELKALADRTSAVLDLATTLVRVANSSDSPSTTIELQLFKATPFVARVGAVNDQFRRAAISLLEALVVSAGKATSEPLSLLGYLGPQISRAFLQFLSILDRPFDQAEEVTAIWRFFSTIIRNRQQWMANCLLTGKTPRDARNSHDNKASDASPDSILTAALERLSAISSIPSSEALAILDFVTSAQNYWPWTIFSLQKNNAFLAALRSYVRKLKPSSATAKSSVLQACDEARLAAYIAETFAMQLFHLRQMGQADALAKELAQDLDYYLREGVLVSGYNNSLHANFAKNFGKQYPGCSLDNFKRTLLEPRSLGTDYYYALKFADRMLQFDSGWKGPRNNGYKSEMENANGNLSLVDAQIALFRAWEFLLIELSNCLPQHDALKKQSLQVAEQCLEANQANQGHEQIFERLTESRVDLALMLVQRVVNNSPSAGDVAQLLSSLWATISSVQDPYGQENIGLHRTLLKLLYVTLRAQVRALDPQSKSAADKRAIDKSTATVFQAVLSILDQTVAQGFRTVASLVHDSEATVFPEDLAILTAIMQACLCIPGINQSQTQIVNIMAAHDAVHVAVSLYSWSDKLAEKGDPVYGELALLFLLELSALPVVAEQLACDGLLNHITSASLAAYFDRPNVSPFAETVGPQRCYSIWAKAVVPLLLNILTALGQTIAPEVAYVLNQFPTLMRNSVARFEAPGASRTTPLVARRGGGGGGHHYASSSTFITLLAVTEIHSLALMTRVLGALRANHGARDMPEVEWDAAALLENVEFWLSSRKILRERLVPLGPREAEWKAVRPSDAGRARGDESRLEEKVVDQLEEVRQVLSEGLE